MKKLLLFVIAITLSGLSFAVGLTGTKTIPGDYATIVLAISDLNTNGVGTGGVTFNVAAGYTELLTAPLSITATGTASNQIIFQKNGVGTNPLITAYVGTATPISAAQDGLWNLVGSDYVTIDGIDLTDPNSTNPATMEYGYAMFKASVTNGCQYNIIKNCVVSLSNNNNASGTAPAVEGARAINIMNALVTAQTTVVVPTSALGANSYNKIYGNTLKNCNYGIALIGYAGATPFTLCDFGNDIGGSSASTGNSILNFGGAAAATNPAAGVRTLAQYDLNVAFNNLTNNNGAGANHVSTLRGIYINTATSANASISNNTLTISGGGTTSQVSVIENVSGSTAASNLVQIKSNTMAGTYNSATTGTFYGIYNSSSAATVNISTNTITSIAMSGTGTLYAVETGSPATCNVTDNTIGGITRSGIGTVYGIKTTSPTTLNVTGNTIDGIAQNAAVTTGSSYGFYSNSSAVNVNVSTNIFRNFTSIGASSLYGIYEFGSSGLKTYQNNQIYNFSTVGGTIYGIREATGSTNDFSNNQLYSLNCTGGTAGAIYGIYPSSGTTNNIYKNKIYDLSLASAGPSLYGIYIGGGTTNNIYNNLVGNLSTPAANAAIPLAGIYISGGSTSNVYYNTVNLNSTSTGALFGSAAIYASTTPTLNLRNNILVNTSTPMGATGYTCAYRRSGISLTAYAATSNNNLFYAGTPGANNLIFYDGTTPYQTIAAYQTAVAPRDAVSISILPNWVSTSGSNANFLHINTSISTGIESGGVNIATFTDDFDGNTRQGNAGYVGSGTAPDIGADEFGGVPSYTCVAPTPGNTVSTANALCLGQSITLSTQNATVGTGNSFQWKSSTDGMFYTDIAGATSATYSTTPATSLFYECVITCQNGPASATSTPLQITFASSITSTTPGSRCGTGTVDLAAIGSGGTLNWYAAATGGASLGTGSPWTTPSINSTTSFYVGTESTITTNIAFGTGSTLTSSTGYPTAFGNYWYQDWSQMVYTAAELQAAGLRAGNITALSFNCGAAASPTTVADYAIRIGAIASSTLTGFTTTGLTTVYGPSSTISSAGINTITFTTPYSWDGASNIIVDIRGTGGYASANATTYYTATAGNTVVYAYTSTSNPSFYTSSPTATTSTSRLNVTFAGQGSCSSPRSAVVATVNTPPAFSVTTDQTICNNTLATLAVTSTLGDFDSYIWSPVAGLFTDAACSIAYTGTSLSTVYFKTATAGVNTYTCSASNSVTSCANTATSVVTNLPASPSISASVSSICVSGSTVLTTVPATGYGAAILQWQNSTDNVTFGDIAGANSISYTTPTLTSTTYYKLVVKISASVCTESNVVTVTVTNPQITGTVPGNRCGVGTVNLAATSSATINWYAAASGGASLGTGLSFTTPSIAATTTYYAEPSVVGSTFNIGLASDIAANVSSNAGYGMYFATVSAATINSVKIYPSTAGTLTVTLKDAASATIDTRIFTITAGDISTTVLKTLALNFSVPAGSTGWQIYYDIAINRGAGTYSYPYTSNGFTITGNTVNGDNVIGGTRFYFYDWSVTTSCAGSRTPVLATVNTAPTLTITGNQSICSGSISSLGVTSTLPDYDSYTWSPVTGLYTDAACTVPYVALSNHSTVYVKIPTGGTTTYICSSTNSVTSCANVATTDVTTTLTPVAPTTTGYGICANGSIPVGQGLQSTAVGASGTLTASQTIYFDVASQPVETNAAPGNIVSTAIMAPLPAGATVTGVFITYNGIEALGNSWQSDVRLGLSGALINAAAAGTGAANLLGLFNYTREATTGITATTSGGAVNLLYWDAYADNDGAEATFPLGISVASVVVNYNYPDPAGISWYTTSTGGTAQGSGSPFNPIGIYPLNSSTSGTYTWYAEVVNGSCASVRTSCDLVIGSAPSITASASPATPVCAGSSVTLSAVPAGGGAPYTYSWTVAGIEVSTLQSFSVTPTTTTLYDVTLTDNCSQVATTSVTVTVKPVPVVSASSNSPLCSGGTLQLNGNPGIGTSFSWTGPNGFTSALLSPSIANTTTWASGVYSFTATYDGCASAVATTSVVVNQSPNPITVTPTTAVPNGTLQALTATGGQTSVAGNTGLGTWYSQNNTPYKGFWGGCKTQSLYTASELTGMGLIAGSNITQVAYFVYLYTGPYTFNNFTIAMKNTSSTVLTSTLETGTTTVLAPSNYVLSGTAPFQVTHILTTPFVWDGTSNLLVETCFNNNNGGGIAENSAGVIGQQLLTNQSAYYSADNTATVCSSPGSAIAGVFRPDIGLVFEAVSPISWSPSTNLWLDAAGTLPYNGEATTTVYANPSNNITYTAATKNSSDCSSSGTCVFSFPAVTFNVDMSTDAGFTPGADNVYLTGDFPGASWVTPGNPGSILMTQVGVTPTYTATLALPAGTYNYKYFQGSGWDGGEWGGDPNRSVSISGDATINNIWGRFITWANLQSPASGTITEGGTFNVYAQAYIPYATATPGATTGLVCEIGISLVNNNPSILSDWHTWIPATFNVQAGNNDEFTANIAAGLTPGTYYYASRFKLDDGSYVYGGYNGGFWGGANVSGVLTVEAAPATKTLNLKVFLEGLWDGTTGMMKKTQDADADYNVWDVFAGTTVDTLTVLLANADSPFDFVYQAHAVNLNADGTMTITVPATFSGGYYIALKHRSCVETWSATAVSFASATINYDFSSSADMAFGSNQLDLNGDGSVWGLFIGDVDSSDPGVQDGYIDFFDLQNVYNLNVLSAYGYQKADVTGDGFVDFFDLQIVYNNNVSSRGMNTPPNPAKRPMKK